MAQHFLLSSRAKTLSLAQVMRMTDEQAEQTFRMVSRCAVTATALTPTTAARRFRCRACRKDFSITSRTLFASHKLPLSGYLAAIAIFVNEVKGKSALAFTRGLGVS